MIIPTEIGAITPMSSSQLGAWTPKCSPKPVQLEYMIYDGKNADQIISWCPRVFIDMDRHLVNRVYLEINGGDNYPEEIQVGDALVKHLFGSVELYGQHEFFNTYNV